MSCLPSHRQREVLRVSVDSAVHPMEDRQAGKCRRFLPWVKTLSLLSHNLTHPINPTTVRIPLETLRRNRVHRRLAVRAYILID